MESDAERNEIRGDQDDNEQYALCAGPGAPQDGADNTLTFKRLSRK